MRVEHQTTRAAAALIAVIVAAQFRSVDGQIGPRTATPRPFQIQPGETARIVAAHQDVAHSADRTGFDVKARAASLGSNPDSVFAFVRDEIGTDLYPGILRGASGTLSAGSGNDLDKALLLGALLVEGRQTVRFAHCTLPMDRARARVTALFSDTARPRRTASDIGSLLGAALRKNGFSDQRASEILADRQTRRAWLEMAVAESAAADLAVVRAAVKDSGGIPAPATDDTAVMADARDHYWLQIERGGSWVDLDPSTTAPGAPCAASETFAAPPAALFQTVTLEVRNEFVQEEKLSRTTVLTHRFRVSDAYGRILILDNIGIGKTGGTGMMQFGADDQYRPALQIGDSIVTGSDFVVVPKGGAFVDAFSGGPDGPTLVAQWIDFTLEAPRRKANVSRALVDFVNPAERAAGKVTSLPNEDIVVAALAQGCAIAVSAGPIDPVAVLETSYGALDAGAIGRLHDAHDPTADAVLEDAAQVHQGLMGALALSYAATAEQALVSLGARAPQTVRVMRDQPMLTLANLAVRPRNGGGGFVAELAVDYRHSMVRTIADDPAHALDAFWTNVQHGLTDGAIEQHWSAVRAGSADAGEPFTSRTAIALARAQSIEVRGLSGDAAAAALEGDLADAGGRRLLPYASGRTVLIGPVSPVHVQDEPRFGGWLLNLDSGHLIPLTDAGLHGVQSPAERRLLDLTRALGDCLASTTAAFGRCRALYYVWRRQALVVLTNGIDASASVVPNFWQLLILG